MAAFLFKAGEIRALLRVTIKRRSRNMFWHKKSAKEEEKKEKLSGPEPIPGLAKKHLIEEEKIDPYYVHFLKAVVYKNGNAEGALKIRIYDESDALAKKVQVKDYTSLGEHPDLIIYEGELDGRAQQIKLEEKKKLCWDTTIFSQAEILQKIEVLSEPGSTLCFYVARGMGHGGPLGMGATIVELNPAYPGKKQKKYNLYSADVIDMQPVGKGQHILNSDDPGYVAKWIKEAHHKRIR